jgi:hypothetical protein
MRFVAALAAVLAVGCAEQLELDQSRLIEGPAGTAEALTLSCAAFGVDDCPAVYWYAPTPDVCDNGGTMYRGTCYGGYQAADGILLVLPDFAERPSDTALTHELAHWRWGDADHRLAGIWPTNWEWSGLHEPGSRVGDQNVALASSGL